MKKVSIASCYILSVLIDGFCGCQWMMLPALAANGENVVVGVRSKRHSARNENDDGNKQAFQSSWLVTIESDDILSTSFGDFMLETWNTMAQDDYCDPFHRRLSSVLLQEDVERPSSQAHDTTKNDELPPVVLSNLVYQIHGYCDNCVIDEGIVAPFFETKSRSSNTTKEVLRHASPSSCNTNNLRKQQSSPLQNYLQRLNHHSQQNSFKATVLNLLDLPLVQHYSNDPSRQEHHGQEPRILQKVEMCNDLDENNTSTTLFETTLLVEIDTNILSDDMRGQMEEAFMSTYNDMQLDGFCDPHLRSVEAVILQTNATSFLGSQPFLINPTNLVKFQIIATCRGCDSHDDDDDHAAFSLFHSSDDDDTSHRKMTTLRKNNGPKGSRRRRRRQDYVEIPRNDTNCTCFMDPNEAEAIFRPPTMTEFLLAFNTLQAETDGTTIIQISPVTEYECSPVVNSAVKTIFAQFYGDISTVTDQQFQHFGDVVMDMYNALNYMTCDVPMFRMITKVDIQPVETGGYWETYRSNIPTFSDIHPSSMAKLTLHTLCRECFNETNLLSGSGNDNYDAALEDDLLQRIAGHVGTKTMIVQDVSTSSSCFCPWDPSLDALQPPSERLLETAVTQNYYITPSLERNKSRKGRRRKKGKSKIGKQGQTSQTRSTPPLLFAGNLFEADELECSPNKTQFERIVYINTMGDLTTLTNDDMKALEGAFMMAYNHLNFALCDAPFFSNSLDSIT